MRLFTLLLSIQYQVGEASEAESTEHTSSTTPVTIAATSTTILPAETATSPAQVLDWLVRRFVFVIPNACLPIHDQVGEASEVESTEHTSSTTTGASTTILPAETATSPVHVVVRVRAV